MDIIGQYRIAAPREVVWAALNDPDVLRRCIPGCRELDRKSDTEFTAKVTLKIGPMNANFTGAVTLQDLNPPESYTIAGQGQGGAAGFAKGSAEVKLTPDADHTILDYTAKADVGGKLASLGSRLIQATSKKLADEFFSKFAAEVGGEEEPAAAEEAPAAEPKQSRWKKWLGLSRA
ncbi:MAG: CoxG family protein [Hyphomicrobiaceae bacterium]